MLSSLRRLVDVLVAPDRGMAAVASARRAALALALAAFCSLLCGLAFAARVDVKRATETALEVAGTLKEMTDRALAEEIARQRHVAQLSAIALGAIALPALAALLAILGRLAGWLLGGRATGEGEAERGGQLAVASHAILPLSILALISAIGLLHGGPIASDDPAPLAPSSLGALGLLQGGGSLVRQLPSALGLFGLWSAILWGLGTSAATGLRRRVTLPLGLAGYGWIVLVRLGLERRGG